MDAQDRELNRIHLSPPFHTRHPHSRWRASPRCTHTDASTPSPFTPFTHPIYTHVVTTLACMTDVHTAASMMARCCGWADARLPVPPLCSLHGGGRGRGRGWAAGLTRDCLSPRSAHRMG